MAALHGKGGYFAVEDSVGSTIRDLSPYLNSVTFSRQNDNSDVTTFGQVGHVFITGLTNGTITLAGFWDKTTTVGLNTVLDSLFADGGTESFAYAPEGLTPSGNTSYSGECILVSMDISQPVGDVVSVSATLQISGAVTKGVTA